ncbi:Fe-S cluster assembly sulfur transfer protein SufU [Culicoidibacter larvae]|uniref:SUF system NifU family Fe-S cluster assembly protein n=1 Tax=Culicoidibacter larvae TaxID=2579976 RepID=A0A5R8Q903_9FIRM|nr:SUF system NifU family Fe-S cluster assembly protein [Culicoidibacter larvae]TLG71098.1 SUF system NifU family Fe-S cluster assembly protein [Culicoidibacter larvae]
MTQNNIEQWYRQIIMDHYQNPRNKGLVDDDAYHTIHLKNPSCGDDIQVQVKLEGEKLVDVRHQGSGCSICCASASMMSELLKAKTIQEADEVITAFKYMVSDQPFDEDLIEEAISLHGVAKLPPRIKCATLAWTAVSDAIHEDK